MVLQLRGERFCNHEEENFATSRGNKIHWISGISRTGGIANLWMLNYRSLFKYTRFPSFQNNSPRNGSSLGIAERISREKFHAKIQAPVKTDVDHHWGPSLGLSEGKGQASVRPASGRQLPEREKLLLTRHEKRLPALPRATLQKNKIKTMNVKNQAKSRPWRSLSARENLDLSRNVEPTSFLPGQKTCNG